MPEVAAKILLDAEFASTVLPKLKRQASMMESQLKLGGKMFDSKGIRDFTSELDRANQRVITLGIAFQSLRTVSDTLSGIVRSSIEVEKAFTDINSVFELTSDNLDKFGKNLFEVARETSQGFKNVADAAKEFSRQGLSAEETLKRVKSALTLSRVASIDVVDSVNVLTASINGFSKAGLTASDITNKLLAVDTRFAVSASDLADALARSGSAASDAGVQFDQLLGIITAVQQSTARGGAVIGNSLKTIFTRIQREDTIDALESLGVSVRDANGEVLSGIQLLENFGKRYDTLGDSAKRSAAEIVGGVYQINILKAAVADLSKAESIYSQATKASSDARDEETKRNEALNKSLDATITRLGLAGKQIGANIGNLGFSQFARTGLNLLTENPITKALEDASGKAETLGGQIAEGFIKGFGNAVLIGLGPILLRAVSNISSLTFGKITSDLLQAADTTPLQAYTRGRQGRIPRRSAEGYIPNAAGSYIPFSQESSAISQGVGGAPLGAKPVLLSNFKYGGGMTGPILANSSEYIVPNFANGGSAIFNQNMIKQYGLPPGSTPVAAGGYIPNAAEGINPGYSGLTISQVNQYLAKRGVFNYGMPTGSVLPNPMDLAYRVPSGSVPPNFIGPVYPNALGGPMGPVTNPVTKIMGGASFPYTSTGNLPTVPAGSGQYALQFAQAKAELSPALNATQKRDLERAQERELRDRKDITSTNELIANQKRLDMEKGFQALEEERKLAKEKLKLTKEEIKLSDEVAKNTQYLYKQAREAGQKLDKEAGLFVGLRSRNLTLGKPEPFSATFVPGADPNAPTVRQQMSMQQSLQSVRQAVAKENERYAITASLARRGGPDAPDTFFSKNYPTFQKFLQGRRGISENAATALSFGLPFAAGFVPERAGGTQAGMISGAASGALMGGGLGVGLGSAFGGPTGAAIGGGIGAVGGGIVGLISKMNESFAEMTERLDRVTKGIKGEYDAALQVLLIQEQITEALSTRQFATARTLQDQLFQLKSGISNPEYLKIIGANATPELKRQQLQAAGVATIGANAQSTAAENLAKQISILTKENANFLLGESDPERKAIVDIAKQVLPLISKFTPEQLSNLEQRAAANRAPMGRQAGQFGAQEALNEILKSAGIETKGPVSEIGSTKLITQVLREAFALSRRQRELAPNENVRKFTPGLLTPQEVRAQIIQLEKNAIFENIRAEARRQTEDVRQRIAFEPPGGLTDLQRLELTNRFQVQNLQTAFTQQEQLQTGVGISKLLETIKTIREPQIRNQISGITDLQGLLDLRSRLGTLKGKEELPGVATPKFLESLDDLIKSLSELDFSTKEQIKALNDQTLLLKDNLSYQKSAAGVLEKYNKQVQITTEDLADAVRANESPDVIAGLAAGAATTNVRRRFTAGQLTSQGFYGEMLGNSANQQALSEINNARAIRYLLANPDAIGARDLTGQQITGGLLGGARRTGLQGKSGQSFTEGFSAVFTGIKRELMDLSDVGANIANSLQSNLSNAFGDFVTGAKNAKDAFKDFAISVLNDASRAFASKAVQGLLTMGFQAIGLPMGSTGGQFTGGAFKFAKGGKVPALLTGGEYVIPPDAARSIGYDTLRKINRYADGGLVNGGSGVKDDVPARLAPGSFVIKKSTVNRLGPDYFHSLSNGGVQKRFVGGSIIGGALVGALVGGGIGYATGGKKGAIGGAILGGIAGGVYSYNAGIAAQQQSAAMGSGGYTLGGDAAAPALSTGTKVALGFGAAAGLGLLSAGIGAPKKESQAIPLSEVPRYAAQLEAEQEKTFATNRFAYLGRNSGGGYSIGSFGPAPATRRFAGGGMVGGETQMAMDFMPRFANGGEVGGGAPLSIQSPTSSGGSGNTPNVNVKIEINNNGQMSSSKSTTGGSGGGPFNEDFANKLESAIRPVVQDEIIRQMRNDGIFSQRSRFVNNF